VLHGRDPVHESRAPASLLRATLDRDIMGDIGWHRRGIIVNHRVGTPFKGMSATAQRLRANCLIKVAYGGALTMYNTDSTAPESIS